MKRIACFCIPAHGHTNPMLPVAAELVSRGDKVKFYSFVEFEKKIRDTGAEFVSCDKYLPELSEKEEAEIKRINTTEMAIQDIRITLAMDEFLSKEFKEFQPDVVYTDSACFWGKLNAWKYQIPMVVSTSTFAFNQLSSTYMKQSPRELADMILGLPKIGKELKKLEPYGYHVKNALTLVQSDNQTESIVYTSRQFQPFGKVFSDLYSFVGPSVFSKAEPNKKKDRPLVYISMGTVINDRPDFYTKCMEALGNMEVDVILSCGNALDQKSLGTIPDNFTVHPYVDQLDVLSRADVFITHCGMNSVSESLYMATPLVLYPQTSEQYAVAMRTAEIGAGKILKDDSVSGIKTAVSEILQDSSYSMAAADCSAEFRACSGTAGAADYIESAPHTSNGEDFMKRLNQETGKFQLCFWVCAIILMILFAFLIGGKFVWIIGVAAGVVNHSLGKKVQIKAYNKLVKE